MALITGNTYPVKEAIKRLGGRWNRVLTGWDVLEENAEAARTLVESAGTDYSRSHVTVTTHTVFAGGGEVYTNRRGRCEDAPCCGCCS